MQTETYEVIGLDVDGNGQPHNEVVSEEALALIESLDLAGQRTLVEKRTVGDEEVVLRIPYRKMTAEEQAVFGALMPNRIELGKYGDGPIPLRALQVAAHAKSLSYFTEGIEVWCPEPGRDDPVLVGKRKAERGWGTDLYILARWGDVLLPFEELRAKAQQLVESKMRAKLAKVRGELSALESGLSDKVDSYLRGGDNCTVYAHVSFADR